MKTSHIIILVVLAAAFGVIVSNINGFSTYETFETAAEKPGKEYVIIGTVDTLSGPMEYDALVDPNKFVFYAKDKSGESRKVVYSKPKPRDIERSEKITMTGKVVDDVFICRDILTKCPSKYEAKEIAAVN